MKGIRMSGNLLRLYNYLRDYHRDHGYAPSIREMCAGVGFSSTSVAERYLKRLESDGIIFRNRMISRGTVLNKELSAESMAMLSIYYRDLKKSERKK